MNKQFLFLTVLLFGCYSCRKPDTPYQVTKEADYKKAESLVYKQNDSAFYYFSKFVTNAKDSLQIAMAYNRMALIQSDAGDYFGAQETLLMSLKFLDENDNKSKSCLSSDYNELGMSNVNLKNYRTALTYYDLAIKNSETKLYGLIFLNNKALVYQKMKAYAEALKIYTEILPQTKDNQGEYARILSNMARTKWLRAPGYYAAPEMLSALRIRQKEKDLWGQNASYAHLSDYYTESRPDSAFLFASEMYAVARKLNSPDDRLEALEKLVRLAPVNQAKQYFKDYQQLNDSVQTSRAAARNQFALIRYEAEKNKADNLLLQKENTEKKYQIIKQYVLLGLVLLALVGAVLWYRNAIRASRLKTSKKVHDVVANGLYRMMSELENQDLVDKELLIDKIDQLYHRSRDISHDQSGPPDQDFPVKTELLIKSFSTPKTKVVIVGNETAFWQGVGTQARYELEQVLQELMVNMKKHSRASDVLIKFEAEGDLRVIDYTDNGVGFTAATTAITKGSGLKNTGNRIKTIHGRIIFEDKAGEGLHIQISFPAA